MNASILIKSFSYVTDNFRTLVSLSLWSSKELTEIKYKKSKLKYSLQRGDIEVIKLLIDREEDNIEFNKYISVYPKHKEMVKFLLIKLKKIYSHNISALGIKASEENDIDMVEYMFQNNIKLDQEIMVNFARIGNLTFLKIFETRGFELINNRDMLQRAAMNNHFEIVEYLMEKNMEMDILILEFAWKYQNINMIRKLLNYKFLEHKRYLISVVRISDEGKIESLDIVKLLLDHNLFRHEMPYKRLVMKCITEDRLDIIKIVFKPDYHLDCDFLFHSVSLNLTEITEFIISHGKITNYDIKFLIKICRENNNQKILDLLRKLVKEH